MSFVIGRYFKNGKNLASGIMLCDLTHHVANFRGEAINTDETDTFTFGDYIEQLNISPVRIYLHTEDKTDTALSPSLDSSVVPPPELMTETDSDDCVPDIPRPGRRTQLQPTAEAGSLCDGTVGTSASTAIHHATSGSTSQPDVAAAAGAQSPHEPESTGPRTHEIPDETGTPTVIFRARQFIQDRLSLRLTRPQAIIVPDEPAVDDDVELQAAIIESMEVVLPDETLEIIIRRWITRTQKHDESYSIRNIIVQRERLLASTLRVVNRQDFDPTAEFKVVFSGEDGDDLGGPKREFLKCLMFEVQSEILHGGDRNKVFLQDLGKLSANTYHLAGKLVAFSILHGGPGLPVLNREVYLLMTGREICTIPDLECVTDIDDRLKLTKLQDAKTDEEYVEGREECADLCLDRGLSTFGSYRDLQQKDELLKIVLKHELLYRVHAEITQFCNGMDDVGHFFKTVMAAPDTLQPLFVSSDPLTFESLRQLYDVDYSIQGSNNRRYENDVMYCFEAFLSDCESGSTEVSLGDILSFWTGAESVPPLGFASQLHIDFIGGEDKQLPSASTCGMVLHFWRGYTSPDLFARDFTIAIQMGAGFYLV